MHVHSRKARELNPVGHLARTLLFSSAITCLRVCDVAAAEPELIPVGHGFVPPLAPVAGGGLIWLAVVSVAVVYVLLHRSGRGG
jgi:hypothetical protein